MRSASSTWGASPFSGSGGGKPRFAMTRLIDLTLDTEPRWLVEDLLPKYGLVVVWGPPSCGKSFWTFDLVGHVALGRPYGKDERYVEQGAVLYIAAEGEGGSAARGIAFRREISKDDDPPLFLMPTSLDLVGDCDALIDRVHDQLANDGAVVVIVIDTLNRTLHGSESKDEDMGAYVKAADRLRAAFNCAVILIHHCGVNGERPRGHTSLTGAVDTQLAINGTDGVRTVKIEKLRDGVTGGQLVFNLIAVKVGIEARRNKPITSCVVEHLGESAATKKQQPRMTSAMKRALEILFDMIARGMGVKLDDGGTYIPTGTLGVRVDDWRTQCYRGGISTGGQEAKRKAFVGAHDRLVAEGLVGERDEWVWPVKTP
jgi:hypothetical protein